MFLDRSRMISKINEFAMRRDPFLFVIDFDACRGVVLSPEEASQKNIFFNIQGVTNYTGTPIFSRSFKFESSPVSAEKYRTAYDKAIYYLNRGDTYLINLTFPTELRTDLSFDVFFCHSDAPYKLLFQNKFVVFSPESFIEISDGKIISFPMKGTIDADLPGARQLILDNQKELFEHTTIVDLIRNDLSMVSKKVKVDRFRFIDQIQTNRKNLLQVSSEISGELEKGYLKKLGEIIFTLLPPGSVTGAPKEKTVQIIREIETYQRGFYTGIFGFWNGHSLKSAVMIRFIERIDDRMIFKSGGGITAESDVDYEYEELIQKVYVPIF